MMRKHPFRPASVYRPDSEKEKAEMARLKVWGGTAYVGKPARPRRIIVCASSQRQAAALVSEHTWGRTSLYEFRRFWSVTGNAAELETATRDGAFREGVWVAPGNARTSSDYQEAK